ncbi:MAG: GAF domain-containing sensor histidine kinase [Capsulimonadales bacterium]|nr:GAF domain-containing sensor histidine kinase [Capsulimonadales bacterium]
MAARDNKGLVLETVSRVALDILAERTGVEALRHIADAARTLAGAEFAALGVAHPNGDGLSEFVSVGLSPAAEALIGPRPVGKGILGMLLSRTEPLMIADIRAYPGSSGMPPKHPVMTSFLGVPIRTGETTLGSLYLTNKIEGSVFTEADATAVQALGAHAAVTIRYMQMEQQQRRLVSGLISAQEEERRAVAYDLHDGLTQYVMAAHAHLEAFRRASLGGRQEKAARDLDLSVKYLKEAVLESRRLVNGLRMLALDDLGLAGAIEQLLADEKKRAGWGDADLIHNISGRRFDGALETAVYRVAQEALTNARKHAHAGQVRLVLLHLETDGTPQLRLEVQDDGVGFSPESSSVGPMYGVGLQSMVERVRLMGGRYELATGPGSGTAVRAIFPATEIRSPDPEIEESH